MKIVLLGGLGLQGKAALADLAGSPAVQSIICADTRLDAWETVAVSWIPERSIRFGSMPSTSRA